MYAQNLFGAMLKGAVAVLLKGCAVSPNSSDIGICAHPCMGVCHVDKGENAPFRRLGRGFCWMNIVCMRMAMNAYM